MKKIFLSLIITTIVTLLSCGEGKEKISEKTGETCFYTFDKNAVTTVRWTAFKTSDKIGVGGEFTRVNVIAGDRSTKITDVLKTIKFNIPTSTTYTGNEVRDEKIIDSFFGTMNQTDLIIGQATNAEGNNESGTCSFYLTINNIEKEVVLNYALEDNVIKLTGEIDITNWNGTEALAALNEVCSAEHKGDGDESITWPTVELSIESVLKKDCH